MSQDRRWYVGLATTFHDPAIALLDPSGEVVFAEATERYLQYKRAYGCEPDSAPRMEGLLREHLPADAEIVIATTWSGRFTDLLDRRAGTGGYDLERIAAQPSEPGRSLMSPLAERAFVASLRLQQHRAGIGTVLGLQAAHGHTRLAGVRRYPHHLTHATYAALSSPYDEAACLVVDGMGEMGSSALYRLDRRRLHAVRSGSGRVSLGFFFMLVTELCGFDPVAGEEWKVMGLAPYGRSDPTLRAAVRRLVRVDDGRLRLASAEDVADAVSRIRSLQPDDLADGWADLARAGQDVFVELMDVLVTEASALGSRNLVLGGGCALNSSYNGTVVGRTGFDALHVPPAPADDGNAIGAALCAWLDDHPDDVPPRPVTPYLGTPADTDVLARMAGDEPRLRHVGPDIDRVVAELLVDGAVVGWMRGRAEFGPRALGNRSLLADPRPADAKARLNAKVKLREPFRPFAPSILEEHVADWFDRPQPSPYMERTLRWREDVRARVPAVVHEDGTGRLQTVSRQTSPDYHGLISHFHRMTGVPLVLNTSLNVMGRPIVHRAEDALLLFYTTGLDALAVEDWLITK